MLRAPAFCSFRSRDSISETAQASALAASFASVTTGTYRCGMPLYSDSSMRLGSMRMRRTSSGVARMMRDMSSALMHTDLPVPVEPAMSRCGIGARSRTMRSPPTSLPMPSMSGLASGIGPVASTSPRVTVVRCSLGTSMPMSDLPGIGREHAHVGRRQGEREVVRERGHAVDLHALGDLDLEQRDGRPGDPVLDARRDVEGRERRLDDLGGRLQAPCRSRERRRR